MGPYFLADEDLNSHQVKYYFVNRRAERTNLTRLEYLNGLKNYKYSNRSYPLMEGRTGQKSDLKGTYGGGS